MTPEQQQIAIEEWCGWTTKTRRNPYEGKYCVFLKDGKPSSTSPPDYLNDLNAMHEAEKGLKVDQIGDYENRLYGVTDYRDSVTGEAATFWSQHSLYRNVHATAAQRAEALLRTIGKWVD